MAGEVTKMVSDRATISNTVLGSVKVQAPEVAPVIERILFPEGPPANLTVQAMLVALGSALERSVAEIKAADITHANELADDGASRAERDEALSALRAGLMDARDVLAATYGQSVAVEYGLDGETPTIPGLASQRAAKAAGLLRSRPMTAKPKRKGVTVDASALAADLEDGAKRLDASLVTVQKEEREAQLTLNARNESLARWNARYQGVADTITGLYELAEKWELAAVVRPTSRRRAGVPEEGDPVAPPVEPVGPNA
jgi:hypothetical protein